MKNKYTHNFIYIYNRSSGLNIDKKKREKFPDRFPILSDLCSY